MVPQVQTPEVMRIQQTSIDGLLVLHPKVFLDTRGYFLETFNERAFRKASGIHTPFVQDNESLSHAGVLRGLHYQEGAHAQGKLVRVVQGAVLDVVVDIRPESASFGAHAKVRLDAVDKCSLWVPPGFAHGFVTLENDTVFVYKCTAYYHQGSERTILWNDPELDIDWGISEPLVSDKDRQGMAFSSIKQERTI